MRPFTVLFDSCVFYPARLRSLLMYLGGTDLFWGRWTDDIHEEWMQAVLENFPDISRADMERTRDLMNESTLDCLVTGYRELAEHLSLPDLNDRHVLAAAIVGRADAIVTFNLDDFPSERLRHYDIEAIHPDDFLLCQFDLSPAQFLGAVNLHRGSLKNPPRSPSEYLDELEKNQLPRTVELLRRHFDEI
jgi:hypothetical protein